MLSTNEIIFVLERIEPAHPVFEVINHYISLCDYNRLRYGSNFSKVPPIPEEDSPPPPPKLKIKWTHYGSISDKDGQPPVTVETQH